MSIRRYSLAIALALGASAAAGPDWDEGEGGGGDAGSFPGSAQVVTGTGGGVLVISGRLGGPGALPGRGIGGDFQDMYLIRIDDPEAFRATTLMEFDGFAEFDAQMFLFQPDGLLGFALLANQDATVGTTDPLLLPFSTDGTDVSIQEPGLYFLAITGRPSSPLSIAGPMFNFASPTEVSGPDGNGGFDPISDWSGPGETGEYKIGLRGVVSIPIGELGCDPADIAPPFGLHDMTDVLVYLSQFGMGVLDLTDLAPPFGSLDFSDVIAFLLEYADGCP